MILFAQAPGKCEPMTQTPGPHHILVVDDEPVIADTFTIILKKSGYDAFTAYSAEEALPWCLSHHPDVVFTDVVMGSMNGIQLAQHLAESLADCKVVLMSGHILGPSLLDELQTDQFTVFTKPVHPKKLLDFLAAYASSSPSSSHWV